MAHTHTGKAGFPLQRRHEAHGGARKPAMSEADDIAERIRDTKAIDDVKRFAAGAAVSAALGDALTVELSHPAEGLKEAMREQKRFTAGGETCRQWGDRLLAQEYDNLPTIPGCDDTKETAFDQQIRRDAKAGKLDALAERARAQCRAGNVTDLYGNPVDH